MDNNKIEYFKKLLEQTQPKIDVPKGLSHSIMQKIHIVEAEKTRQRVLVTKKWRWSESPIFFVVLFVLALEIWIFLNIDTFKYLENFFWNKFREVSYRLTTFLVSPDSSQQIIALLVLIAIGGYFLISKAIEEENRMRTFNHNLS